MARLFALADLHLSQAGLKPMEIFGDLWKNHAARMADGWDRTVGAEDWVLLGGDLSWGRSLAEAEPDLAWIGARPGRKLFLKGNHDSWWRSANKVRLALPPHCSLLHNDAVRIDPWVVVGARGWVSPDDPRASESDVAVYHRELERLRLSIRSADERFGRDAPRLALVHYPPRLIGEGSNAVVDLLTEGGVQTVVYGHLHGEEDHARAIRGELDGLDYRFVAADAVGFRPVEIHPPGEDRS